MIMARNDRFERGYRDQDRIWNQEDDRRWSREADDYGWRESGREYGARGREEYDLARRERERDYDFKDRDFHDRDMQERDRERLSHRYGSDLWNSPGTGAGYATGAWPSQAYGGWSTETGTYGRPYFGGMPDMGRSYGSDYMRTESLGWPREGEGPHSGRGPRSWRRSDQRIEDDVYERLSRHGYIDASEINIEVKDCEVTLKGRVTSKEEKRLAEDVAEGVFGVEDVHNDLKVEERAIEGHESTVKSVLTAGS
jgi:osmotically-inducible protein OsmY